MTSEFRPREFSRENAHAQREMTCCGSRPRLRESRGGNGPAASAQNGKVLPLRKMRGMAAQRQCRSMDAQARFVVEEHDWAWTRIAQLCVPAVARSTEPKFVEQCSTKQERQWALKNYVQDLEDQGWSLKGPVETIWAGEREQAKVESACSNLNAGVRAAIARILSRVPTAPKMSYQRRESTLRRAAISSEMMTSSDLISAASMLQATEKGGEVGVMQTPKEPHEIAQMQRALDNSPFFAGLDFDQKQELIAGVHLEVHDEGSVVIQQDAVAEGDLDKFYIIKSGRCEVFIGGNKVARLSNGHCFGELALLFSSPRVATCITATPTSLWAIRGPVFRKVMQRTTLGKREQYSGFLQTVPLLAHLSKYEIGVVADALTEVTLEHGEPVVTQGEIGHSLFIVKDGQLSAESDTAKEVFWGPGDHFAEASMLLDVPMPMTIKAVGMACVLQVSRRVFKRIVSQPSSDSQQVREILKKNHIPLDAEIAAKLLEADEEVWADSEEEEDVDTTYYPVILDKVEEALDSSCQDLERINQVLDEVDDEEFDHPAVRATTLASHTAVTQRTAAVATAAAAAAAAATAATAVSGPICILSLGAHRRFRLVP